MKYFHHTAHKALWNWLGKNPNRFKQEWPGWWSNGGKVYKGMSSCLACNYAAYDCKGCPMIWDVEYGGRCMEDYRPYHLWRLARDDGDWDEAARLAAMIRDLPVKEGVICK